ncbi:MAG: type II toxin-antitoxin system HicA family toxin [Dehalococcoidales bacterium]|nr:type II toxin-antitoxin system HicA family toxin [Dehalococcoidales bacterium]
MGQKEKLISKLLSNPKDFSFEELEKLLNFFSYIKKEKGRTSGSRVMFINEKTKAKLTLHKPHPRKELLNYQIKEIIEHLKQEGLL